jgi:Cyclic nucleotide-binding domain
MWVPEVPPVRDVAGNQTVFQAGEAGPVWRVVEGVVRLDRDHGPQALPVQLALPGDLIGIEGLCDQRYQFTAVAFTACRLEAVSPAFLTSAPAREALIGAASPSGLSCEWPGASLMRAALLQQQERLQDMALLRTGSVMQRMAHLLRLLGLPWQLPEGVPAAQADAIRAALPGLRELAQVVDAKTETVCRALAQLLPPRSRKSGPPRHKLSLVPMGRAMDWPVCSVMAVAA